MNNLAFDPVTGQPINPAVRQQQVQPTLTPMAPNGMPAQPVAAQIPNPAVYGNQQVMNTGMAMYGSPEMRQNSVAYMKGDLDKDGQLSSYEANRQSAIDKAMAKQ